MPKNITRLLQILGCFLLVGVWIKLFIGGNLFAILTHSAFLFLAILFLTDRKKFPQFFTSLFIIIALVNGAGWTFGLYEPYIFFDSISHCLSTLAVTLTLGNYFYRNIRHIIPKNPFEYFVLLISFGVLIGVFWEFFEVFAAYTFEPRIAGGIDDVIDDLVVDTVGAVIAAFISVWYYRKK